MSDSADRFFLATTFSPLKSLAAQGREALSSRRQALACSHDSSSDASFLISPIRNGSPCAFPGRTCRMCYRRRGKSFLSLLWVRFNLSDQDLRASLLLDWVNLNVGVFMRRRANRADVARKQILIFLQWLRWRTFTR